MRSGGYGIAGWAVAGDVIVDMSMIRDIDIEPPIDVDGAPPGTLDWTPLKDMPAIGSKGKGRAQPPQSLSSPAAAVTVDPVATGKRRREDGPVDSLAIDPTTAAAGRGPYDAASYTVATFLRGPPLPVIPGDTPREPPTNRPRLNSLEPGSPLRMEHLSGEHSSVVDRGPVSDVDMSPPHQPVRSAPTDEGTNPPPSAAGAGEALDAFRYITSNHASPAFGQTLGSDGASTGVSAVSPLAMGRFMQPPSSTSVGSPGVMAWNPMMGFSASGPGPSQFPFLPAMSMSMSMSMPAHGPSAPSIGLAAMVSGASSAGLYVPAAGGGNGHGEHLGTMNHARPVHPHAYVTFGAGMRQKEVDIYTAEHPFVGLNPVTGEREEGTVPYHIPM